MAKDTHQFMPTFEGNGDRGQCAGGLPRDDCETTRFYIDAVRGWIIHATKGDEDAIQEPYATKQAGGQKRVFARWGGRVCESCGVEVCARVRMEKGRPVAQPVISYK